MVNISESDIYVYCHHNNISEMKERIVVVGGGFAGLTFIKKLDKNKFDITLVDTHNFHSFPPLFYQVASSGLDPASISFPFRRELRRMSRQGVRFHLGSVRTIDTGKRTVTTERETIPYDHLVIAAGTTNNFFGNDSLRDYVYTLKSTPEALRCRNAILERLELASTSKNPKYRARLLSFAVVGGGPTGVEIAGALGEMKKYILPREYPEIDPDDVRIEIIEGSPSLLGNMSAKAQKDAVKYLNELLVHVNTSRKLKSYDGDMMTFADGSTMEAGMVIWTAGVTAVRFDFKGDSMPQCGHGGRILCDGYNRVQGVERMYALGDIALVASDSYPNGYPQLAQPAIQQARLLASALNRGQFDRVFSYNDKGTMATVGRNRAVVDLGNLHLGGFMAWAAWMGVHLMSLLGMRNKITVLVNWIWAYFTYATSLRILMIPTRYPLRSHSR